MALQKQRKLFITLIWLLCIVGTHEQNSVKKDLTVNEQTKLAPPGAVVQAGKLPNDVRQMDAVKEQVVVISEKTLLEKQKAEVAEQKTSVQTDKKEANEPETPNAAAKDNSEVMQANKLPFEDEAHQEDQPSYKSKIPTDLDIPDSFKNGFYLFLALSTAAVLLIVIKIHRMRLSRAERKYGVQGDRTTQELTPLPVSIEDGNSDEDDQTLFEINRQQIRIL